MLEIISVVVQFTFCVWLTWVFNHFHPIPLQTYTAVRSLCASDDTDHRTNAHIPLRINRRNCLNGFVIIWKWSESLARPCAPRHSIKSIDIFSYSNKIIIHWVSVTFTSTKMNYENVKILLFCFVGIAAELATERPTVAMNVGIWFYDFF